MAPINFNTWPKTFAETKKPFDRLLPFHRVHIPERQFLFSKNEDLKLINGDAFSMGARSTKDYDGKFGQEIGEDLAELLEKIFPVLATGKAFTHVLAAFLGKMDRFR